MAKKLSNQEIRSSRGQRRDELVEEVKATMRASHNAVDAVDDAVCARVGINRTDLRCLDIVHQHAPIAAGALARSMGLTTGAITTLLDRLERAGYLRRVRDGHDRRKVLVELTPEANDAAWELYGPIGEAATTELERYSDSELELIRSFLARHLELNTEHAARLRAWLPRQG